MGNRDWFTRILAIFGMILLWLPLLAPVFFSLLSYIQHPYFIRFDYLMPLELFPVTLAGGALLIIAAVLARTYRRLICGSVGVIVGMLLTGNLLAVFMGWASGRTEPGGAWFVVAQVSIVIYCLASITAGVSGILLLVHLFKPKKGITR